MALHGELTAQRGTHVSQSAVFANATDRTTWANEASGNPHRAGPPTAADVGRIARQTDNETFWLLTDHSPITWIQLGMGASAGPSILLWGDDGISTTTTTRYLTPGYDDAVAETTAAEFRIPVSGTLKNMRVRHNTAGVGAATITYTLEVNGSGTSLAVAMSNTVQDGSDLSNTASVSAGDLVRIEVTKSAAITTSPDNIVVSMELAA